MKLIKRFFLITTFLSLLASNIALVVSGTFLTAVTSFFEATPLSKYMGNSLVAQNRNKHAKLKAKTGKTVKRIAQRSAIAVTRNTGSAVFEALPVVGVATIITMTALDIKDSCDTLKDVNSMLIDLGESIDDNQETVCGMEVPSKDELYSEIVDKRDEWWEQIKGMFFDIKSS